VDYVKGIKSVDDNYDLVLITTLFTFDWEVTLDTILFYSNLCKNSEILVGGIYASILPDHIYKNTGIRPYLGCIPEVDECTPDYTLFPREKFNETSFVITSRGCGRNCKFCGTGILEPELRIIKNWKNHFLPKGKYAVIHDNNILLHGDDHFNDVISFLKNNKLYFMFDNGFDCRLFEKRHARQLSWTHITEVRFSFDTMQQDGYIQNAIKYCKDQGIQPYKIKVFVLYNYEDDVEDALSRVREIYRLGARPYAMRYKPLKWLNPKRIYVSKKWNLRELYDFGMYVNKYSIRYKFSYDEWKSRLRVRVTREIDPLIRRKRNIEVLINNQLDEANWNNDDNSLFSNRDFIFSFFKDKTYIKEDNFQ
jgi:hypothetical protein